MGIYLNIIRDRKIYRLNTPEKLFKWMNENMNYGYKIVNGEISYDFEHFYPDYRLQSPIETFHSKVGVCWDQAVFEQYIFNKVIYKKCKFYYIVQDNPMSGTHTFIIYEDNGKYYYFENSYERIRGIYEVNNLQDTFNFIIENMRQEQKDKGVRVYEVNKSLEEFTDNFTKNCDIISFMDFCESCKLLYKK